MKFLFFINPKSGYYKKSNFIKKFTDELNRLELNYDTHITQGKNDALLHGTTTQDIHDIFVAVGGDGTVNEVLNAAIRMNKIIGIIPVGTGNMSARMLKIPMNWKASLHILKKYKLQKSKIGYVETHDRYFMLQCGIGLEADIAKKEIVTKKRFFHLPLYLDYILKILSILKNIKVIDLKYRIDGKYYRSPLINLSICNITFMNLENLFGIKKEKDKLLVIATKKGRLYQYLIGTFKERFSNKSNIVSINRCKNIKITTPNLSMHCDGELIGKTPVSIRTCDLEVEVITA